MFQINENSLTRLMEASQTLHEKLVQSPLWEILKGEPVIMDWINALSDVDGQIKKGTEIPDASKK